MRQLREEEIEELLNDLFLAPNTEEFFKILTELDIENDPLAHYTAYLAFVMVGLGELAESLDTPERIAEYCQEIVKSKTW